MTDAGSAIVIPPRMPRMRGPGWPDSRGWVILGFFALEFFILWIIQLVTTLTTGGVLLIAMNMFGGTRAGAEMNAKVGDALTSLAGATPAPPPKTTP
jgi:hypothetical protein